MLGSLVENLLFSLVALVLFWLENLHHNPSEKILYLLQYLAGAPKKVVEGYQFVSSPDAYQTAKGILEKRFGHPSVVADAFRERLENWQRIAPRDGAALREFADFLQTCKLAMHSVEDLETLNKESGNKKLVKILPAWTHPKWGTMVRDYQLKHGDTKVPPFTVFVNFVTEIAEIQCLPVLSDVEVNKQEREDRNKNRRRGPGHGADWTNSFAMTGSSYKPEKKNSSFAMTGSSYKPEKKNSIIHHKPVAQQIKMYAKTHLKTHCKNPEIPRNALLRQPPLFGRDQERVAIATNSQTSTLYSFIHKERPPVFLGKHVQHHYCA